MTGTTQSCVWRILLTWSGLKKSSHDTRIMESGEEKNLQTLKIHVKSSSHSEDRGCAVGFTSDAIFIEKLPTCSANSECTIQSELHSNTSAFSYFFTALKPCFRIVCQCSFPVSEIRHTKGFVTYLLSFLRKA